MPFIIFKPPMKFWAKISCSFWVMLISLCTLQSSHGPTVVFTITRPRFVVIFITSKMMSTCVQGAGSNWIIVIAGVYTVVDHAIDLNWIEHSMNWWNLNLFQSHESLLFSVGKSTRNIKQWSRTKKTEGDKQEETKQN